MKLITEPLPPTRTTPNLLVLYSQPKIGKTTALSQLPGNMILEVDNNGTGADFLTCMRHPIKKYEDLMEYCDAVIAASKPYKYGSLDSLSEFIDLCEIHATAVYRRSNAGRSFTGRSVLELTGPDFNPGYRWLRLSFKEAINKLLLAFPTVILVGHIRDKFINIEDEKAKNPDTKVSTKELDLPGQIRAMVTTKADSVGYMFRKKFGDPKKPEELWISFETNDTQTAGNRCSHLIQRSFKFDWKEIFLENL